MKPHNTHISQREGGCEPTPETHLLQSVNRPEEENSETDVSAVSRDQQRPRSGFTDTFTIQIATIKSLCAGNRMCDKHALGPLLVGQGHSDALSENKPDRSC